MVLKHRMASRAVCLRGLRRLLGMRTVQEFSIAVFAGERPWDVAPLDASPRPALTRRDVVDVPAAFVADPFLLEHGGGWAMFFEVMRSDDWRGVIALATSSDAVAWTYRGVVLDEPFHLSYPHVFAWEDEVYMIPETFEAGAVRLYRATRFPTTWVFEQELLTGSHFSDATVFRHDDRWWMFVDMGTKSGSAGSPPRHDTLHLFFADDLRGPWTAHPMSPILTAEPRFARPAGRVVEVDGLPVRFAQECTTAYGLRVHAFEIEELTPTSYRERRLPRGPVVGPGNAHWNRGGMHHVDAHRVGSRWLAAVDGWSPRAVIDLRDSPLLARTRILQDAHRAFAATLRPERRPTKNNTLSEDTSFD